MLNKLAQLWVKIAYAIDCQVVIHGGLEGKPLLLVRPWTSEIDPLLCKLYLKTSRQKRVFACLQRIRSKGILWFLKPYENLPAATNAAPSFYQKRMHKALERGLKEEDEDLLLMYEGWYPSIGMILEKRPQSRVVVAHIEGLEESPFALKKATPRKWTDFFKSRKKVKMTFVDLSDQLEGKKPEEIEKIIKAAIIPQKAAPEAKKRKSNHEKVKAKIAQLANCPVSSIKPEMDLYEDVGLDSLDVTELVVFLEQKYQVTASFASLEKVGDILQAAEGFPKIVMAKEVLEKKGLEKWVQKRPPMQPPQGKTIPEAFLRSCERMENALACVDPQEVFSYVRLKSLALGLVGRLKEVPGERIGVLLPPSGQMYAIVLGLLFAKKTVVMLNATLGPKHLDGVIQSANLQAILTTAQVMEHLAWDISDELEKKMVLLEDLRGQLTLQERQKGLDLARKTADELMSLLGLDRMTGDETAVILFTSGTEKIPKGVPLSHTNLMSNQRDICEAVQFFEEDVLLGILPAFHIYGFAMTGLFPLLTGLRVIFHPSPLDLQGIAHQVEKWKATIIATAPTFLKHFAMLATVEQLASVRLFIIGAEKPPPDLIPLLEQKSKAHLLEGYGLTECSPVLTLNPDIQGNNCVGRPLPHVEILILHPENHTPVPRGEQGLIVVRGPNICAGYLHGGFDPFIQIGSERWFTTNDIGFLDEKGRLYLVARMSRTVKIGGEMISLPFVEDLLLKGLGKRPSLQIAIMGEEDARKGSHLILYTNQELSVEEVNHLLHEEGGSNLLKVREVRLVSAFPMTALGKIDYKRLKEKG